MERKITQLTRRVDALLADNAALRADNAALRATNVNLWARLEAAEETIRTQAELIVDLRGQLVQSKAATARQAVINSQLRADVRVLQRAVRCTALNGRGCASSSSSTTRAGLLSALLAACCNSWAPGNCRVQCRAAARRCVC